MTRYADETRQFNEYAAKKAREDRERETGREVCPKCDSDNTHAGYGMAAGGIGCYTICMDCGYVLASVQDPEP